MRIGFLGLGRMGTPMALNLCKKYPTTVWNRSPSKYPILVEAGAVIGESPSSVLEKSDLIYTMLFDEAAIQSIVDDNFTKALKGKILVNASSVSVEYSKFLSQKVSNAGGKFVEMPVSGSRVPAEQGKLVGMMAGDREMCDHVKPYVQPLTSAAIYCGEIGSGLGMKYAINAYLVTMTAGLAESMNLARAQKLDLKAFSSVLEAGSLSSVYSKMKVDKILAQDWTAQAAVKDCYNSTKLIRAAARKAKTQSPLVEECGKLYGEANSSGLGEDDMIAVFKVLAKSSG